MSGEGMLGWGLALGCGLYLVFAVVQVTVALAASDAIDAEIVAVSSGIGQPYATAEYRLDDGEIVQVQLEMSSKASHKKYRVGERIVLRLNRNDSSVRKGDALSLWFQPLMALTGVALSVIFILRARRTAHAGRL